MTQPCPQEEQGPAPPTSGQGPVLPTRNLTISSINLTHQEADTKSKKSYDPTACEKEATEKGKMRWQRNMFQMKEQDKNPQEQLSEMEIGNLTENDLK